MDEWKEGVWLGVGAFITAMLITFAVVLGSVSQGVARMQQNDMNTVASLEECRKWAKYRNDIVNQGDVINCILENRTQVPAVAVTVNKVTDAPDTIYSKGDMVSVPNYLWDGKNPPGDYAVDTLNVYVPPAATYRAYVIEDANGAILNIWFRRIT